MASFMLSFFPLDVLDEIWDLIESVSEEFLTYSWLSDKWKTLSIQQLMDTSFESGNHKAAKGETWAPPSAYRA